MGPRLDLVSSKDAMSVHVLLNPRLLYRPLSTADAHVVYMMLMEARTKLSGNAARVVIVPSQVRVLAPRTDVLGSVVGSSRVLVAAVVCLTSDHSSWRWAVGLWEMRVSGWWKTAEVALASMQFGFECSANPY